MATKAELEAELAELRAQMAKPEPPASAASAPDDKPESADAPGSGASGSWEDMLKTQGIDPADATALLEQLSDELGDLPRNKPMLTAIAAFAIGFALGRMSK